MEEKGNNLKKKKQWFQVEKKSKNKLQMKVENGLILEKH